MACPPPFTSSPSATARRTARPMSTPGIGADAAGLKRDGKSRPAEFLLQTRSNEPDDARMPALGRGHDDCALVLDAESGIRFGFGLRQSFLFDRLALTVEPIELSSDLGRLDRIILKEEPHTEIGSTNAAAGINPRPEQKTEMPGLRRAGKPGHVHQADVAGALAPAQRDQSFGHKGAIKPSQRNHVGDRAERDVGEEAEEIRFGPLGVPKAARAESAADGDHRHEGEPDSGEMA